MFFTQPIPIPMEDDLVHTDDSPFCSDPSCPCHDDPVLIAEANVLYQDGLLTDDAAMNYVLGRQV